MIGYPMVGPTALSVTSFRGRVQETCDAWYVGHLRVWYSERARPHKSVTVPPLQLSRGCNLTSSQSIRIGQSRIQFDPNASLWNSDGPALGHSLLMHPARVSRDPTEIVL